MKTSTDNGVGRAAQLAQKVTKNQCTIISLENAKQISTQLNLRDEAPCYVNL